MTRLSHTSEPVHPALLVILVVAVDPSMRQWLFLETLAGLFEKVQVVPLSWFTRAEVDMDSGGKFLRRIEWFLDQHEQGKAVLARNDRNHQSLPDRTPVELAPVEYLSCPLGHCVAAKKRHQGRPLGASTRKKSTSQNIDSNKPTPIDYVIDRCRKTGDM